MWFLRCSARGGAVCMSPSRVPMSSSPPLLSTSCCTTPRACWRHSRYGTRLWAHRAPPHSRNTPAGKGSVGRTLFEFPFRRTVRVSITRDPMRCCSSGIGTLAEKQ
ncbi:unnamed protein product [Ixodes pacificus]